MKTTMYLRTAFTAVAGACLVTGFAAAYASRAGSPPAVHEAQPRNGQIIRYWPGGVLKSDISYRDDAYEGEYRTFYASGARYEVRHYVNGHEDGVQQSWSEDGTLYLNYDVRAGRRYGLVNATPCSTVGTEQSRLSASRAAVTPRTADAASSDHASIGPRLPYYADATFSPHWTQVDHRVAPFELITQRGTHISDRTLSGRAYVASFVYTSCAAVCPILVRQLSRVQDALGAQARIVSFSVTPDTDTPEVLAAFGRERGIDPRRWSLVTGSKRTIYTLARTSYFADDSRVGDAPDDERAFLHTEKLLLVDGTGRLRGVYNGTQPHAVDQLIDDFRLLADSTR